MKTFYVFEADEFAQATRRIIQAHRKDDIINLMIEEEFNNKQEECCPINWIVRKVEMINMGLYLMEWWNTDDDSQAVTVIATQGMRMEGEFLFEKWNQSRIDKSFSRGQIHEMEEQEIHRVDSREWSNFRV